MSCSIGPRGFPVYPKPKKATSRQHYLETHPRNMDLLNMVLGKSKLPRNFAKTAMPINHLLDETRLAPVLQTGMPHLAGKHLGYTEIHFRYDASSAVNPPQYIPPAAGDSTSCRAIRDL